MKNRIKHTAIDLSKRVIIARFGSKSNPPICY